MVLNIDSAPMFLHYAGVGTPAGMQGRGFRSIVEAHTPWDWRKSLYDRLVKKPTMALAQRRKEVGDVPV